MNRFLLIGVNNRQFGIDMEDVLGIESVENNAESGTGESDGPVYDLSLFMFNTAIGSRQAVSGKVIRLKAGDDQLRFHVEKIDGSPRIPDDRADIMPPVCGDAASCFLQVLRINNKPVPVLNPLWIKRHYPKGGSEILKVEDSPTDKVYDIIQGQGLENTCDERPVLREDGFGESVDQDSGLESRLTDSINLDTVTRVIEKIVSEKVGIYLTDILEKASSDRE